MLLCVISIVSCYRLYPGMILCTTPPLGPDEDKESRVVVHFDDAVVDGFTYLYMNDPVIHDVKPEKGIYR